MADQDKPGVFSRANPNNFDPDRLRATAWGVPFVLGLLLFFLGILAAIASGITGVASVMLFGGFLVVAGVLELVGVVRSWRERGGTRALLLVGGLFALLVGIFFLMRPLAGLSSLTLLLAAYFLVTGLFNAITTIVDRYRGWGWDFAHGIIALVLGVAIFRTWPESSLAIIGLFVGLEIAMRGATLMAASMAGRQLINGRRRQVPV